jgi:transcriptional regulator with XRE-family HTH domain
VRANRFALELTKGPPPFDDAIALHSCDNPPCCNPAHLRWGTTQENTSDSLLRRGDRKGENSPTATITNETVARIYQMRLEGWTAPEIAAELELPKTLIMNIYVGRAWGHRLGVDGNPTLAELRAKKKLRTPQRASNRIVTDEMVDHILQARMAGSSIKQIADELGLAKGTVSPVFSGLVFTHRLGVDGNPTLAELRSVRSPDPRALTEDDRTEIRAMLAQGIWGVDIAKCYGISTATVSNIKNGKR